MKQSYYFPHDSNARTDTKILELRAKYGARGYGLYFMIIEMLREANNYELPIKMEILAYELCEDSKIIKDIIENFELFKIKNNVFFSESLCRRLEKYDSIIEKRRISGKKGGEANAKQVRSKQEANAKQMLKQTLSKLEAKGKLGEERRGEEIKGEEIKEKIINISEQAMPNGRQARGTNYFLDLFKNINPSYEQLFKNKTQRAAIERLIKKYGDEKVEATIHAVEETNKKKYAPTIITPLDLETKLGALISFINKQQQNDTIAFIS